MSIDRSQKHLVERLSKMVPLPSVECRRGLHDSCSGNRVVVLGGEIQRVSRGANGTVVVPDSVEARCGCECHR